MAGREVLLAIFLYLCGGLAIFIGIIIFATAPAITQQIAGLLSLGSGVIAIGLAYLALKANEALVELRRIAAAGEETLKVWQSVRDGKKGTAGASKKTLCPKCEAAISAGVDHCPNCGAPVSSEVRLAGR